MLLAQPRTDSKKNVELIRPESYAIRRFNEIVEAAQNSKPDSLQERIIRERALLKLAETRLNEYRNPLNTDEPETEETPAESPSLEKSLRARVDHHFKVLKRLEKKALKQKRKR